MGMSSASDTTHLLQDTYDAIVVGARIAGAATAALLAQQGARVLLLERARFPAPTVSCPIFFGNSLAVLDRIGALGDVEAIGAPRITYYGTRLPEFDLVTRLPVSHGRDYAYSIRREVLDTAILRRVQTHPDITLREGFDVREVVWSMGRVVGVRGRQQGGAEQTFYADAVIGADGKRSMVARQVDAPVYDRIVGATAIFYAYYRNFAPLSEPSAVVYGDPQSMKGVLVFDADAGLTVMSVGVPAEKFDEARKDPEGTIEQVWRSMPELAERGRNAERATPVMGQAPVDSFYRKSYGPGWALVGDAGHYVDPITGQGINHALRSAELFSDAWTKTRRRTGWMQAMAEYQRQRDAATRPMWDLVAFGAQMQQVQHLEGPLQDLGIALNTALFRAIARQPRVAAQYVGMFSGATPVRSFMNPVNLARVLVRDTLRNELPRRAASILKA
jgi:2-polyprenyl-6-methoxyphenol hydroxylase-like FAD-dependent oxidoreductase